MKQENIYKICNKKMNLVNSNEKIVKKIWWCQGQIPKYDVKIRLRIGSIYENIKVGFNTLYYLTFFCFLKNMSIRRTKNEIKNFFNIMGQRQLMKKQSLKFMSF